MAVEFGKQYVFEEFQLFPGKRELNRDGVQIRLANRPFQVLLFLIENRDRWVLRDELLAKFWNGRDVYDEALTKCIGAIRKALREPHEKPRFIETRWAEGYRFIGDLAELNEINLVEIAKSRKNGFSGNGNGNGKVLPFSSALPVSSTKSISLKTRVAVLIGVICAVTVGAFLLTRRQSPKAAPPINSIAVMPFKNLSNNPEKDIFAEGMTESLVRSLSKVEGLKVISRGSVLAARDKSHDPRQIAVNLGVATVLEGSVLESADKVRVEVRLIGAENGEILWSAEHFDRASGDVFEIQEDIARRVALRLRSQLTPSTAGQLTKPSTTNIEAYQAYLKGRHFWRMKTPESLERSRKYFEEAISLDPDYVLPYAGLADYYFSSIWYSKLPHADAIAKGKALVARVLELDDSLSEGHSGRARVAGMEWDWATALKETEKALELDPNNASVWQGYAFLLVGRRGGGDAVAAIKRAYELDPLSANIGTDIGVILTFNKRYNEAIEALLKVLEMDSRYADAHYNIGVVYELKGEDAHAFTAYTEADRLNGEDPRNIAACETAFAKGGIKGLWRRKLEIMLSASGGAKRSDYWVAALNAHLGEKEQSFLWLERAFAAREPLVTNMKLDYKFDSIHNDPRFDALVQRAGL